MQTNKSKIVWGLFYTSIGWGGLFQIYYSTRQSLTESGFNPTYCVLIPIGSIMTLITTKVIIFIIKSKRRAKDDK